MAQAWKIIKWTAIGLTGLFLSLVLFLAVWIDPNDYRDEVASLVKQKTGLILKIDGTIGWNFFPAIGFSVEQLSLAPAENEPELAAIGRAAVSVQFMPLFQRRINVNTLFIDGLRANLRVDANGKGNWESLVRDDGTPKEEEADTAPAPEIRLPQVVLTNAVIDYDDQSTAAHYTLTLPEFVAEDVGLGSEFPLRLRAAIDDHKGLKADIELRSFVTIDTGAKTHGVRGLELKGNVAGVLDKPLDFTLSLDANANLGTQDVNVPRLAATASNLFLSGKPARASLNATASGKLDTKVFNVTRFDAEVADLAVGARPVNAKVAGRLDADLGQKHFSLDDFTAEASNLDFTGKPVSATAKGPVQANLADNTAKVGPLAFNAAGVGGTLTLHISELTKEPALQGSLDVSPFNAKTLLKSLGIDPPKTTNPDALAAVSLKAGLEGTKTRAMLSPLEIRLDGSTIRGKAGLSDLATTALVFDLVLDRLDADGYLPPPVPPGAAPVAGKPAGKAAVKPEPLLPVETLRTLNLDGRLAANQITFMQWPMTNLSLAIRAKEGQIAVDPLSARVIDGSVAGNVRIDARGNEPRITTNLKLDRLEVAPIIKRYTGKDVFLGKASFTLDMDATGNDTKTLMKKAVGGLDLSFTDATLLGMSLNNILTGALTEQLGAFAMLVPDYQKKLPRELKEDTVFNTLAGGVKVKDGIASVPALNAGLKDGKVSGQGEFNLLTMDFNYRMAMKTDRLKDNKYLANLEFPVVCKGNIAGAPSDWCRPDVRAMGDLLKKAAENAAKDRLKGEVASRLGLESVEKEALREQATQAVEQQKDAAEQKAKERINEEMQKRLKKLF